MLVKYFIDLKVNYRNYIDKIIKFDIIENPADLVILGFETTLYIYQYETKTKKFPFECSIDTKHST